MFKWIKDKISNDPQEEKNQDIEKQVEENKTPTNDHEVPVDQIDQSQSTTTIKQTRASTEDEELRSYNEKEEITREDKDQVTTSTSLIEDEFDLEEEIPDQNIETADIDEDQNEDTKSKGFFARIFSGLEKTRKDFSDKLGQLLGSYLTIDDELYEDLEDILITADIGVQTTIKLIDNVRENIKENKITDPNAVPDVLKEETKKLLDDKYHSDFNPYDTPSVVLVVGVNGVGKTTTVAKLAAKYKKEGYKVMMVAADTFRAAATDQLKEWSTRTGVDIVAQDEGADPAAVVFDAIQSAKAKNTDIVLVDTAGRLHNKKNLMNELEKISKTIEKNFPEARRESLIVLDATTGQNAISQAREFSQVSNITAIAVTKLDGTAKGGVVLPLIDELGLPVSYIGVGEQVDDLQEFDSEVFIDSIFE